MLQVFQPFLIFACLALIFKLYVNRTGTRGRSDSESFWEKEARANHTRKQDISGLDYITFSPDTLPLDAADALGFSSEADTLRRLSGRQLINLSMYTNTDLKAMYGPANLPRLSEADEGFTLFIRTLNGLANRFLAAGETAHAKTVLELAVTSGSDITESYVHLAELYRKEQNTQAFDQLRLRASTLTSLTAKTIQHKLDSIKSEEK